MSFSLWLLLVLLLFLLLFFVLAIVMDIVLVSCLVPAVCGLPFIALLLWLVGWLLFVGCRWWVAGCGLWFVNSNSSNNSSDDNNNNDNAHN